MFSEPLNVDNEISQTYPYYTPHGTYYYSAPMQPSFQMGQPQVRAVPTNETSITVGSGYLLGLVSFSFDENFVFNEVFIVTLVTLIITK